MRMRPGMLALLAGCSFQHGVLGGDDGPRDARVDTPMIDAPADTTMVVIDAPPDTTMPPTDTDSDGVPDTTDNCVMQPNADQRNHDADAFGDACDRCPHLASATDPDGDGDGVGDDCDPRPTTGGDQRVLWQGFYDANATQGWTAGGNGNWSVANGRLTQSSSNTSTTTHTLSPPLNVGRAAVTAGVRVIALGNQTQDFDTPHVSVVAGVQSSQSYWCSVVNEDDDGNRVYATTIYPIGQVNFPNSAWPGTFTTNSELRLTGALLGSTNTCTAVQATTAVTETGPIGQPGGSVQVATRTASASFDYLFVVSIGN